MNPTFAKFPAEALQEIKELGFDADPLLESDLDCPVFGFNLACAWPFPPSAAEWYRKLNERLSVLDADIYVYPGWETHVTIATFVNFNLHRRMDAGRLAQLRTLVAPVRELIEGALRIPPFELCLRPPVLSRKAAILPITDPAGAITRIRQSVRAGLATDEALHKELTRCGFNIPGIIHSTVMRFKKAPADVEKFIVNFQHVADTTEPCSILIDELLLTTETKPYMREGEVIHRFGLR